MKDNSDRCISEIRDWVLSKNPECTNLQLLFNCWHKQSKHKDKIKELFLLLKEENRVSDPALILYHNEAEEMFNEMFHSVLGRDK